jgi:ABC-type transporter Mla subunit MlaD
VLPGNRRFHEAIQELSGQAAIANKAVRDLSSHVESTAAEFEKTTGRLAPSFNSLCDTVDQRFAPAVAQQGKQIESIGQSIERLREVAEALAFGMKSLQGTLEQFSQVTDRAGPMQDTLAGAAKDLADAGKHLRRSIESDMSPSQRTMRDSATSLANTTARMSDFMEQGLVPATRELATLHDTLRGLEGVVASIKTFSHARADIERLNDTLARSAEISDAIAALPEQLREILEHNANHSAGLTNFRGKVRNWLVRRPK